MSQWVIKGLRAGIKSTRYPRAEETAAGTSPGLPAGYQARHGAGAIHSGALSYRCA